VAGVWNRVCDVGQETIQKKRPGQNKKGAKRGGRGGNAGNPKGDGAWRSARHLYLSKGKKAGLALTENKAKDFPKEKGGWRA